MIKADIDKFKEFIRQKLGIELPDQSDDSLQTFLSSRLDDVNQNTVSEYIKRLLKNNYQKEEFKKLAEAITNGKTSFFRHAEQLSSLCTIVKQLAPKWPTPLNVWSAGCSTGEEVYTLAIALNERGVKAQVTGSDVDGNAIETAQAGTYPPDKLKHLEKDLVDKYFVRQSEGSYAVNELLKTRTRFLSHNLVGRTYPTSESGWWHVILCRNVLIYFSRPSMSRVVEKFSRVLSPGGLFLLSPTESIHGLFPQFKLIERNGSYFYQLKQPGEQLNGTELNDNGTDALSTHIGGWPSVTTAADNNPWSKPPLLDLSEQDTEPQGSTADDSDGGGTAATHVVMDKRAIEQAIDAFQSGDRDDAIMLLFKHLKKLPQDFIGRMTLGNALTGIRDFDGAIEQYLIALDIDPLSAEAHFLLGMAYRKANNLEPAIREMKNTLFLDKGLWLASYYLADVLIKAGKKNQAKNAYENTVSNINKKSMKDYQFLSYLHGMNDAINYKSDIKLLCVKRLRSL